MPGPSGALRQPDLSFLVEATRLLASSLEVEATLSNVARLSLPHLGSWCVVDLSDGDKMRRLAIIHPDPGGQALADQLLAGWPPDRDDPLGAPSAMRTRSSQVVFPVTDEMLIAAARSPKNLDILRALRIGSFMTVPLLARGEVLGAITYVSPDRSASFSESDVVLAEDLAARCAIAIDNSRLLRAAEQATAMATEARRQAESALGKAEEANLVKMRFLSTMSHELRTPLNAIAGYAQLLETGVRGALTEPQLADVRRIRANERHLLTLVETVLGYARVNAGRIEFGLEDVPLERALEEMDAVVAPLAAARRITLHVQGPSPRDDVRVYADADKLRQILVNLVANAIKFSPDGGRVEITHRVSSTRVSISVVDHGIGIATDDLTRIFEPFVQVGDGLTNAPGGTGLGLAISRELALGMDGTLTAESELGRGSTFTLTLSRGRG